MKYLSVILTLFYLAIPTHGEAQIGNLLKKTVKEQTKKKNKEESTTQSSAKSGTSTKSSSNSNAVSSAEVDRLYNFYKTHTFRWYAPSGASPRYLSEEYETLKTLIEIDKRFAEDKQKYPAVFDGSQNGSKESTVRDLAEDYEDWQKQFANELMHAPGAIQMIMETGVDGMETDLQKQLKAIEFADRILHFYPNHEGTKSMRQEAIKNLDKKLEAFREYLVADEHKLNIDKMLVLKDAPKSAGKNQFGRPYYELNTESETDQLVPGEPLHLLGFFGETIKESPAGQSFITLRMIFKPRSGGDEIKVHQALYESLFEKEPNKDQAYYFINLFPPTDTEYATHFKYIPHLNFAKLLSKLPVGEYDVTIEYEAIRPMASAELYLNHTNESREKAGNYYDKLMKTKIAHVDYPSKYGCTDGRSKVVNLSDLEKYGELVKLTLVQSDNIYYPFPRESEVQWNTASGAAVFKKADGKAEIIPLSFRKSPSAARWKFHSLGNTDPTDLQMTSSGQYSLIYGIKPEKLEYGYQILPENAENCETWKPLDDK